MLERVKVGAGAGLAAGLSVAVMVLVYDLVKLEPLATPRLLASNVLGAPLELGDGLGIVAWVTGALQIGWAVLGYTVAHFAVFALVGVGGAFALRPAIVSPNVATGALYGALVGTAVFYAGLALVAPQFVSAPDWRLVLLTNAVAGVVLVSQLVDDSEAETDQAPA